MIEERYATHEEILERLHFAECAGCLALGILIGLVLGWLWL